MFARRNALVILAIAAKLSLGSSITWAPSGVDNLYSNANNWSGGTVPNGNFDAAISNPPGVQPALDINASLNNLTLTGASSSLMVNQGSTLTLNSNGGTSTISNEGTINVGPALFTSTGSGLELKGGGTFNVTGSGTLDIGSLGVLYASSTATLNNSSTIQGLGEFGGGGTCPIAACKSIAVNNSGTITNSIGELHVQTGGFGWTNTGTISATSSGTLDLVGIQIDNTGGLVTANGASAIVKLENGSGVLNGTISSLNGGLVLTGALASGAPYSATLGGAITINGVVSATNSTGFGLGPTSSLTLNGTGSVNLEGPGSFFIYSTQSGGSVTNNITIQGEGNVISPAIGGQAVTFTNNGTVNANLSSATLTFLNGGIAITNNGTLEATFGGTLHLLGLNVINTSGTISADGAGSVVTMDHQMTITGGTLQTSNGGAISVTGTDVALAANVTLNGALTVQGATASALQLLAGTNLTINGAQGGNLLLNAGGADASLILHNGGPGGTVTLNGDGSDSVSVSLGSANGNVAHISADHSGMTLVNNTMIAGAGAFDASAGNLFAITNNGTISSGSGGSLTVNGTSITNNGILTSRAGDPLIVNTNVLTNYNASTHTLTGGTYKAFDGKFQGSAGFSIVTNQANLLIAGAGTFVDQSSLNALQNFSTNGSAGSFTLESAAFSLSGGFTNSGTVDIDADSSFTAGGVFDQAGGSTEVNGQLTASAIEVSGGTLSGVGTLFGDVTNSSGTLAPGDDPGTLTISGNYIQGTAGALDIEIASLASFDELAVTGSANLDGTLDVTLLGYAGHLGDIFEILNSNGLLGTNFSKINLPTLGGGLFFLESTDANNVYLTVSQTPAPEPSTFLLMLAGLGAAAAFRIRRGQMGK
jgi:fibronectin-binding autotransporter adhesin